MTKDSSPKLQSGHWRRSLPAAISIAWIVADLELIRLSFLPNHQQQVPTDYWLGFVLGLVFAQLSYGGFWIVFGPGRATLRLPLALGAGVLSTTGFLGNFIYRDELEIFVVVIYLTLLIVFQFSLISLSLLLKRCLRWVAAWEGEALASAGSQYGVRDLLFWLAGVGGMLGLFRWTFGGVSYTFQPLPELLPDLVVLVVIFVAALAQAFVAGCGALGKQGVKTWLICPGISLVLAFASAITIGSDRDNVAVVMEFLMTLYLSLWGSLSILAWCGLRLTYRDHIPPADSVVN